MIKQIKTFAILNILCESLALTMHITAKVVDDPMKRQFACLNGSYLLPTTNYASLILLSQSCSTWFFLFIIWYTYYYIPSSMSVLVLASKEVPNLNLLTQSFLIS